MLHTRATVDVLRFMAANLSPRPFRLDKMCCQTWTDITIDENSHFGEQCVYVYIICVYIIILCCVYTFIHIQKRFRWLHMCAAALKSWLGCGINLVNRAFV